MTYEMTYQVSSFSSAKQLLWSFADTIGAHNITKVTSSPMHTLTVSLGTLCAGRSGTRTRGTVHFSFTDLQVWAEFTAYAQAYKVR